MIDTLCDLPIRDGLHHLVAEIAFKTDLRGYLDAYGAAIARSLRIEPKEFLEQISRENSRKFMEWIEPRLEKLAMGLEDFVRFLDGAGVAKAVLYHFDEETTSGYRGPSNDFYAELVQKVPDRLRA